MSILDINTLSDAYLVLVTHGLEHLRRYSLPERFEYLDLEIDHLHNLPSYIGETNLYRHAYYYCTERPWYLQRLAKITTFDTSIVVARYTESWDDIQRVLVPFSNDINEKEYLERL